MKFRELLELLTVRDLGDQVVREIERPDLMETFKTLNDSDLVSREVDCVELLEGAQVFNLQNVVLVQVPKGVIVRDFN